MGLFSNFFAKKPTEKDIVARIANQLFEEKKYIEASKQFFKAYSITPHQENDHYLWRTGVTSLYFSGDYETVVRLLQPRNRWENNDRVSILQRAISNFKIGNYSESSKLFEIGIKENYQEVIEEYNNFFNPKTNKKAYWNNLPENTKYFLCKSIQINFEFNKTIIEEKQIDIITNSKELDFSASETNNYVIKSLEFCKYIPNLEIIQLAGQSIRSFQGLENNNNLIEIDASHSTLETMSDLRNCLTLKRLNLNNVRQFGTLLDLEPISKLRITKMDITGCSIKDFSILNNFSELVELSLKRTKFSDFNHIKNLSKLEILILTFCEIRLTGDFEFNSLKKIVISCDPKKEELKSFQSKNPLCKIEQSNYKSEIFEKNKRTSRDELRAFVDLSTFLD